MQKTCNCITIKLQVKTYQEYKINNEFNNENNIKNDVDEIISAIGCEHENIKLKDKINALKEELIFYTNYYEPNYNINKNMRKIKKR